MEDNPIFNAGHGSVPTEENTAELDAFIMNGTNLAMGAVGCVQSIANPVSLARRVMEDTPHCLLVGEGALKFAKKVGFPILANPLELVTKESQERYKNARDYLGNVEFRNVVTGWDTVGAVALDSNGRLASATSTGGLPQKMLGRVGDSPLVGCGGYANNTAAASTTGHGESIMKTMLAWDVVRNIEGGLNPMQSCEKAVNQMMSSVQGVGGVIALNSNGEFGRGFSSEQMVWASIKAGVVRFGVEPGEEQLVPFKC
ncbi:isoaspartyl peptidase/L-asparaginase-like isoform X4 [Acropora muricata]